MISARIANRKRPADGPLTRRAALVGTAAATGAALVLASSGAADAATWTPLSIRGCDLWLDAATGRATGGSFLTAPSFTPAATGAVGRSRRRLDLVVSPAARPPATVRTSWAARGCLRFTGREGLTLGLRNGPRAATVAAVIQQDVIRPGAFIGTATGGTDNGFEFRVNADGTVTAARSGVWEIGTSTRRIVAGKPNLVAFQYDTNGMWACYVNGQAAGVGRTAFVLDDARTRVAVGYSAYSPTPSFQGRVAEVVRYDRPLLGHELRRLHRYLSAKWEVPLAAGVPARRTAPAGLRGLHGSNIAPKLSQYGGGAVWTSFWADWDWDWVRHGIDVARRAGSNAIRTIGDVAAVASGRISSEQYLERLLQVIRYCERHGLRYYPCGFSLQQIGGATQQQASDLLVAQARLFAQHPRTVVGFDLINELATNYKAYGTQRAIELALALAQDVKRAVPALPITVSDLGDLDWGALSRSASLGTYRRFAPHVDFFDIHVYAGEADLRSWQLAPYELTIGLPLVIGEFGGDTTHDGGADAVAYYRRVRALVRSTPAVRGVFQWAAVDDAFGLQSETGSVQHRAVSAEWRRFPR